jgi:hypothetical protein
VISHRFAERAGTRVEHEPDITVGVDLDLKEMIRPTKRPELPVGSLADPRALAVDGASRLVPLAEDCAVLSTLVTPSSLVTALRKSHRDPAVDPLACFADRPGAELACSQRRLRRDHPATDVDAHGVRDDGVLGREHGADRHAVSLVRVRHHGDAPGRLERADVVHLRECRRLDALRRKPAPGIGFAAGPI